MPTKEEMAAAAAKAAAAKAAKAAPAAKKEADTEEKKAPKKAAPKADAPEQPGEKPEKKPAKKPEKAEEPAAKPAASGQSVKGLRIAAICLWVLAVAAEVGAFIFLHKLVEMGSLNNEATWTGLIAYPQCKWLLAMLAIDLVCCIVAAQLWKKSNRIRPCLAKSALVRTLWHQLGVIMLLVCFIPIGIYLILKTKNLNPKMRTTLLAVFGAIFIAATATSVDYKQPSKEEVAQLQAEAEAEAAAAGIDIVYWTKYGKSYHFDENCSALKRSNPENLVTGSLDDAFGANRWDPCDYCAGGKEAKALETGEQAPEPAAEPAAELAPAA